MKRQVMYTFLFIQDCNFGIFHVKIVHIFRVNYYTHFLVYVYMKRKMICFFVLTLV